MFITASASAETISTKNVLKEGQVIIETIDKLVSDGYITEKNAQEAKKEYVFDNPDIKERVIKNVESSSAQKVDNDISWTEYITWMNTAFFFSTICAIIFFQGVIGSIIKTGFFAILAVPVILYQILFMALTLTLSFKPEMLTDSSEFAFNFALFGSIGNIIILGWIAYCYKDIVNKIVNLFTIGLDKISMLSFWSFIYFGMFALMYESSTFGLLSVIGFVSCTGFLIVHMGLGIALGARDDNFLPIIIFCNLLVLSVYSFIKIMGIDIPYFEHFEFGIQYVCSLALCISLLIASSPYLSDEKGFGLSLLLMILVSIAGFSGGVFYNLEVIPAFTNTFFVLFIIEWLLYTVKDSGRTIFVGILAVLFFAIGHLLSKLPEYFITSLV
jgi:hypothetical protein